MGRDLAVFHEATMDNVRQAKETPLVDVKVENQLCCEFRNDSRRTHPYQDSVTAAMGLVKQYLSMFSCLAGRAYSVFSVNY